MCLGVMYVRDLGRDCWEGGYSLGGWLRDGRVFVKIKGSLRSFVVVLLSIEFFVPFR